MQRAMMMFTSHPYRANTRVAELEILQNEFGEAHELASTQLGQWQEFFGAFARIAPTMP